MPLLQAYLAISLDGFIARPSGAVDWLEAYHPSEFGYDGFYAGIGSIVMGRNAYAQVRGFAEEWPYAGKRSIVVTSQPVDDLPPNTVTRPADFAALASELRNSTNGDVWLFGGAKLLDGFLTVNAIDRFELYVIPLLLGKGMPLLPPTRRDLQVTLLESASLSRGVVKLVYRPDYSAEPG